MFALILILCTLKKKEDIKKISYKVSVPQSDLPIQHTSSSSSSSSSSFMLSGHRSFEQMAFFMFSAFIIIVILMFVGVYFLHRRNLDLFPAHLAFSDVHIETTIKTTSNQETSPYPNLQTSANASQSVTSITMEAPPAYHEIRSSGYSNVTGSMANPYADNGKK